ncbi:hypothetical protein NDU88_002721 [Pleurodeles waltl]|uniref:Uncharacterized protein n=1 Tax=Pleurodeles waltl TaxID=8319 RepID=A0AAV7KSZ0_PLEWA|nr:hypothetical protein NDU88_002721 [Pleurodeles waltl]
MGTVDFLCTAPPSGTRNNCCALKSWPTDEPLSYAAQPSSLSPQAGWIAARRRDSSPVLPHRAGPPHTPPPLSRTNPGRNDRRLNCRLTPRQLSNTALGRNGQRTECLRLPSATFTNDNPLPQTVDVPSYATRYIGQPVGSKEEICAAGKLTLNEDSGTTQASPIQKQCWGVHDGFFYLVTNEMM